MEQCDRNPVMSEIFAMLEDISDEVRRPAKNVVFRQGERAEFIYFVHTGALRTDHQSEDGRNLVLDFLWEGDFLGLAENESYSRSAITLVDSSLKRMRRDSVRKLSHRYPAIKDLFLAQKKASLAAARTHIILLSCPTAVEKIVGFLAACSGRSEYFDRHTNVLTLVMNRKDIADYLGISFETISRIFSYLENENYIRRIDSRTIKLTEKIMNNLIC